MWSFTLHLNLAEYCWSYPQGRKGLFEEMEQRDGEKNIPVTVFETWIKNYTLQEPIVLSHISSKTNLHGIFCHLLPFASSIQKQFTLLCIPIETRA